jgi:aspartyl-tRNA(Asn)/glutamyl-tRNA(Gln) amidotransferase subunit B
MRPEILPMIERVLAAHPAQVESYRKGKTGLLGFLIAQVIKQVAVGGGKANPKLISVLLAEKLG